jgi:hypothetical protein
VPRRAPRLPGGSSDLDWSIKPHPGQPVGGAEASPMITSQNTFVNVSIRPERHVCRVACNRELIRLFVAKRRVSEGTEASTGRRESPV